MGALEGSPLVSCIMPTRGRRAFVPRAIRLFREQTYARRELVVVDDGEDSVADLVPAEDGFRYFRFEAPAVLGAKRNFACEQSCGAIIAHWDDDDWYPPWRLARQVEALATGDAIITGSSTVFFHDASACRAWLYQYAGADPYLVGSTLAYRRAYWQYRQFPAIAVCEDVDFVRFARSQSLRDLREPSLCVASIHGGNTSPRRIVGPYWQEVPVAHLREHHPDAGFRDDAPTSRI